MNEFFLSLIIKESHSLPECVKDLSCSSAERQAKHSRFKIQLRPDEADALALELRSANIDFALIPADKISIEKKLVVFDMDSTFIQNEVVVEMAKLFGKGEAVKAITERAMNGELNFDQALKERVNLLVGLTRDEFKNVLTVLKVTEGVPEFISTLKKHNIKTAIFSGGFQFYADHFKNLLNLDYAFANELEFIDDKLTGRILGPIVNGERKAELLSEIAIKEGATLAQTVTIGDGANDLPMLHKAGLGFAFHAKERVRKEIKHQVNHSSMEAISYYLNLE